jgi:hypothetical protein
MSVALQLFAISFLLAEIAHFVSGLLAFGFF